MAGIQIVEDRVIGAKYGYDVSGGKATRIFTVKNLPNQSNMLYLACFAQDSITNLRIPRYGQAHETIPGIYCQSVDAEPLGRESRINAIVTCGYGWNVIGGGTVQVRLSGMRSVQRANKDPISGNFFTVTYQAPGGVPLSTAYVQFDIYTSHLVLEISRLENVSPKLKSAAYCGKTNQEAGWQGIGGNAKGLWLCQNIDGNTVGANAWMVNYKFEYAPEGWVQLGYWEDNATHIPAFNVIPTLKDIQALTVSGQVLGPGSGVTAQVPTMLPFSPLQIPNV